MSIELNTPCQQGVICPLTRKLALLQATSALPTTIRLLEDVDYKVGSPCASTPLP